MLWLVSGKRRVPVRARRLLERDQVSLSPMVVLEMAMLRDRGRTGRSPAELLEALGPLGRVSQTSFAEVAAAAVELSWARDPFDRLICAQAVADDATLVTADGEILDRFERAVWD